VRYELHPERDPDLCGRRARANPLMADAGLAIPDRFDWKAVNWCTDVGPARGIRRPPTDCSGGTARNGPWKVNVGKIVQALTASKKPGDMGSSNPR